MTLMARRYGIQRRLCSMRLAIFYADARGPITKRVPHGIGDEPIQDIHFRPYRKAASHLFLEVKSAWYIL